MPDTAPSPAARARRLAAEGRLDDAAAVVAALVREATGLDVARVLINRDGYSLNSLNGLVDAADGREFFFKFHQEEGEEGSVAEYYRAGLLERAGFPVDRPAYVSHAVGRQILLYPRRRDARLADLCLAIERGEDQGNGAPPLIAAQERLDRLIGDRTLATLHDATAAEIAAEPIHGLFHARLVDPQRPDRLGGRVARFYQGRTVTLPGLALPWEAFAGCRWVINGTAYADTLADLFADSLTALAPPALAGQGAVTAHGDAHNANVWVEGDPASPRLVWFDPAFAGAHIPTLLAEIKATFHNILAHPFWLYHPALADGRYHVAVRRAGDVLEVTHDWGPGALRRAFLDSKVRHVWRPLLVELARRHRLPADWRRVIRRALFCCPTLVMNLLADADTGADTGRTPPVAVLGFAVAVMAGSEPVSGGDIVSRMLDAMAP